MAVGFETLADIGRTWRGERPVEKSDFLSGKSRQFTYSLQVVLPQWAQESFIYWFSGNPRLCLGDDDNHGDDDDDGDGDDATVTSSQVCLTQRSQRKEGESVMIDSKISSGPARTLNTL